MASASSARERLARRRKLALVALKLLPDAIVIDGARVSVAFVEMILAGLPF